MLAFLAMMLATMSAFNQHAASIRVQEEMVHSEYEIMANAMALDAIETQAVPAGFSGLSTFGDMQGSAGFDIRTNTVGFTTEWNVRYVDSDGNGSIAPTDVREVVIEVYHPRYTLPLVTHRRLIGE
jgi:hypothetical protein